MIAFGRALPRDPRGASTRDLARPGLPREKVLAAVVRLLETTLIRVGNDEYARANNSFGLTTLRDRHADDRRRDARASTSGARAASSTTIDLDDRRLARIVKQCQDLPGQELFQYLDDDGEVARHRLGRRQRVPARDRRRRLHRQGLPHLGRHGPGRAWRCRNSRRSTRQAQAKKNIVRAIESVAERLGNTPAVCRKCYIHPAVLDSYLDGSMLETLKRKTEAKLSKGVKSLKPEEAMVLTLLQQRLKRRHSRCLRTNRRHDEQ